MTPVIIKLSISAPMPRWWLNFINGLRARDNGIFNDHTIDTELSLYNCNYTAYQPAGSKSRYATITFNDPAQYTIFVLRWA